MTPLVVQTIHRLCLTTVNVAVAFASMAALLSYLKWKELEETRRRVRAKADALGERLEHLAGDGRD